MQNLQIHFHFHLQDASARYLCPEYNPKVLSKLIPPFQQGTAAIKHKHGSKLVGKNPTHCTPGCQEPAGSVLSRVTQAQWDPAGHCELFLICHFDLQRAIVTTHKEKVKRGR